MTTNLLIAIKNIFESPLSNIVYHNNSSNRANLAGDSLEHYIKDVFCNSLQTETTAEKNKIFSQNFSYIGNQNNPPDLIIRNGDAIEIKKIENLNSTIALNSSYPKAKLHADSPMITKSCRECEDWREKDILYVIGVVAKENILKSLWFVYGDCYAAEKEIYEKIKNTISEGLEELPNLELAQTNELGRVNKVDPLGITCLRIRGMWHIENPNRVFDYLTKNSEDEFSLNAVLLRSKYDSFPAEDRKALENLKNKNFSISNINIKSPNNPANLLDAVLISFGRKI
jgi:hypothetical protein